MNDSVPSPLKAGGRSIFRALETAHVARETAPVDVTLASHRRRVGEDCSPVSLSSADMVTKCPVPKLTKARKVKKNKNK